MLFSVHNYEVLSNNLQSYTLLVDNVTFMSVFHDKKKCIIYTYAIHTSIQHFIMYVEKACLRPNASAAGNGTITMILPSDTYLYLADPVDWVPVGTLLTVTCHNYTHNIEYSTIECVGSTTEVEWNTTLPYCRRE